MKMKRSLATVLAGAVVLSSLTLGASAADYPDVKDSYWAKSSIDRWSSYGVVQGDTRGQFNPEQPMKRAELATVLANALALKDTASNTFGDLTKGKWFEEPILKCAAAGIMQGDTRGNVNPESPISRQEAAVMLGRALHIEPASGSLSFSDGVEDWAAGYVKALADKGIVNGVSEGVFGAEVAINRASVATILDRAVTTYANKAGETVEAKAGGITLIAAPDVVVTGTVEEMIVTPGATEGKVTLQDAKITGTVTVDAPKSELALEGKTEAKDIVVAADAAKVAVGAEAKADSVAVEAKDAAIEVSGEVKSVAVAKDAEGAEVTANKDAKITTVTTEAKGTEVKGDGKVETVKTADKADTKVETSGTKTEEVKPESGNTDDTKKPSGGGGSGGSSDSGDSGSSDSRASFPSDYLMVSAGATDGQAYSFGGDTTYKSATISAGKAFSTIEKAIDAAASGQTIYVAAGSYETFAQIEKPVKLVGASADKVTLTAKPDQSYILVLGNATEYGKDISGTTVSNLTFTVPNQHKDDTAIYLTGHGSADKMITIQDCVFNGKTEPTQEVAILTPYSTEIKHISIKNNRLKELKYGMYFNSLKNAEITGNTIDGTLYNGINIAADNEPYPASNINVSGNTLLNISKSNYNDVFFSSGISVGKNANETVVVENNEITMLNGKLAVYFASKPTVTTETELITALSAKLGEIYLGANITVSAPVALDYAVTLKGEGKTITPAENFPELSATNAMLVITDTATVTNLTLDGSEKAVRGIYAQGKGDTNAVEIKLNEVKIQNCHLTNEPTGLNVYAGAGIRATKKTLNLTLENCTIDNNISASSGGGISFDNVAGTLALNNCKITGNKGGYYAGGIWTASTAEIKVTMANTKVTGNTLLEGATTYEECGCKAGQDIFINSNSYGNGGAEISGGTFGHIHVEGESAAGSMLKVTGSASFDNVHGMTQNSKLIIGSGSTVKINNESIGAGNYHWTDNAWKADAANIEEVTE